ncbi:hypothetical protein PO909_014552 [Leuciscus waleckii]
MRRLVFLMMQCCVVTSVSCPVDKNQDHRPRVSCVSQSLTTVPDGIKPDTQVLVLTGNHFSSLSWSSYSGFTQLHELDLSHNLITTLEPPGPVLENLSVLRLSGNRLTGLGGLVFRCAPNLMEIFLDANQIRSLHDATFSKLPRLEIINLSQNKLPALPARLLERVSSRSLKTFDLENNSVSLMPDSFFSSKPELPYVFLTYNPWICSCAVGYLHSYLNDQEHNVYMHEAPNGIVPAADSVVCSGPPHLFQRPIIELEENDFCPPDPPLHPVGDWDFKPASTIISVKPNSSPQNLNAPHDTTVITLLPASPKSWTPTWSWVRAESWSKTRSEFWTTWDLFSSNPTTGPEILNPDTTESLAYTTQSNTRITEPYQPTTSEPPTTGPITAGSQGQSTTGSEPHTSRTITIQTEPSTIAPNTVRSQGQSTTGSSRTTTTIQTEPPTTGPITAVSQGQSTIGSSRTTVTVQTEPPTTERIIPRTDPPASVGPHWADARDAGGRILPWCWWLFAGFVLLCLLSALTSCFLCVWLLRNHLTVSRWLKHHACLPHSGSDGVVLQAYRHTEHTQRREDEGESVSFLPLKQLRDVQAVFRSVLFINPPEEQKHDTKGRDASAKIELVSVAGGARDKERELAMSGEVFRKTLHRVISREEEADGRREGWREEEEADGRREGWREEEEADGRREGWREGECVRSGEGSTARYSLILRQERGTQQEMQWVVGEWELGDEGVAYQRSCSLIGQPSTVAQE